ncbi:isoprenylcysteine carboxylmethyltransferase family protein [Leptospira sp. 96542]|nr:isoprenylcysteine carboxylmethyltransferase family protein [Leptospira sp. 96542]
MKKLLPPILLIICIFVMSIVHIFYPLKQLVLYPYNLIGLVFLLSGIIMSMFGSNQFKKRGTTVMTFDEPIKLVQDGLYKYTRNPMYLGFVLFLFGFAVCLGSFTPYSVVVFFVLVTDRWYIKFEETKLKQTFGNEFETYQKNVRRWI